jgi:hypothetical protein
MDRRLANRPAGTLLSSQSILRAFPLFPSSLGRSSSLLHCIVGRRRSIAVVLRVCTCTLARGWQQFCHGQDDLAAIIFRLSDMMHHIVLHANKGSEQFVDIGRG